MILEHKVTENNKTINQVIQKEFSLSTRLFNKLLKNKKIYLNNTVIDTRNIAKINDIITLDLSYEEDNSNIVPTKMDLNIVYEDNGLLVLDKPAGIPVHPSMLHYTNSLSNGVRFYFDTIGLKKKIRPVNRLDLDTSGLIIFAKNEYIQEHLIKQMIDSTFHKEYMCLAEGIFKNTSGTIDAPIARKQDSIIERCVNDNGQIAITDYTVIKSFSDYSLVKCILKTGRTHQIRVHMAHIGHPLVGDTLYGNGKSNLINRQALHSYKISFLHPITLENLVFISEPNFIT